DARVARPRPAAARARRLRARVARRAGEGAGGDRRARGAPPGCPRGARLRGGRPAPFGARGGRVGSPRRGGRLPARAAPVTRELVYGRNAVRELLRGPREILEVWTTERAAAQ